MFRGRTPLRGRFDDCLGIELSEHVDQPGDNPGPSGLVAGAEAGAVVAVEVLVEQQVVAPIADRVWNFSAPPNAGRRPASSRRKIPVSRRAISRATSNRFIKLPEPVGHSILKLSP